MDLSLSPDFDAFYCYGVVLAVGAFVGASQVRQRIGEIEGVWLIGRTWWLLAVYTAVPVVLFWFLDRSGAINDTSFFAAVLVGFGYQSIMTGGSQVVRAPGEVSQFWTPFIAYADRIAKLVRDHDAQRRRRLADRIIAEIGDDTAKIGKLEELARKYAPDVKVLEAQLKAIHDSADARGPAAAAEAKVRTLYNVILAVPDGHNALLAAGVISQPLYWIYVRRLDSAIKLALIALALVAIGIAGYLHVRRDMAAKWAIYYTWRLGKTNSSASDQFRARQNLSKLLQGNAQDIRTLTMQRLANLIEQPALPMPRVELALSILLQSSNAADPGQVPKVLVQALRASSVDARTRVNDALKFMAESCKKPVTSELAGWKPSDGDSTASLERQIRRWTDYWSKPCEPKTG